MSLTIGIDVGGIKVAAGVVDPTGPARRDDQTTAPLPEPESRGGSSPIRRTRIVKPAMNAATAQNAAQPGTDQPATVAAMR
jgi:predicted NBD/HSP70 family sugar kinase